MAGCAATFAGGAAPGFGSTVVIGPEKLAEIVRLHEVEGWRPGTIGRHLGIHRDTVKAALRRCGIRLGKRRSSKLVPWLSFAKTIFERYPKVPSSVVWRMICARGYQGSESHFRRRVRELGLRPRRQAEAFLELRTLPGEQAQVDWASFGKVKVNGGERRLSAFVMVLSYSRRIFVRFFFEQRMGAFLEGHAAAFDHFGGVAKTLLYDNLKSAVSERLGEAVRFNPQLLEMAAWYRFEPRPVAIARGNEKGRVERAISYLRSSFFTTVGEIASLDDLNAKVLAWCTEVADIRSWPQLRSIGVLEAYAKEAELLIALPGDRFAHAERVTVSIGKQPYARFDSNRYSVPYDRVARKLILEATSSEIRIFDGSELVACHLRCWDKDEVIEEPGHIEGLRQAKREARLHRGQLRLLRAVPQIEELLCQLGNRQHALAVPVAELERLLDAFGPLELSIAVREALEAGSPHPATVRLVLDRRLAARQAPPPMAVTLPADKRLRDIVVKPHKLSDYDPDPDPDPEDEEKK
jgi:transposase